MRCAPEPIGKASTVLRVGSTSKALISEALANVIECWRSPESTCPQAIGREKLRRDIDQDYRSFVTKVATARHRKFEDIEPLSQGRVWLGSQAKANGLIDELGGLDRAIEIVKAKAKIPKTERVMLVAYPPKRSIFDIMFGQQPEGAIESRLRGVLKRWQVGLWSRGGMMRLMPYTIDVR